MQQGTALSTARSHWGRFVTYSAIGTATFVLDLGFLLLLTSVLLVDPVPAAGIAFICAITLNYILSRQFVFKDSTKSHTATYLGFIALGLCGLFLVMGLMYIATVYFALNFFVSRILIAGVVGILNYLMNLYVNFSIAQEGH